jgi:glycine betaine/proline transport system permease protein
MANWSLERRFMRWRSDRSLPAGINRLGAFGASLLMAFTYGVTAFQATVAGSPEWLARFQAPPSWRLDTSNLLEDAFDAVTISAGTFFGGITFSIRTILDLLETVLVGTPWPVVMVLIVLLSWYLAGARVAIFTAAALAYLALFGFWEKSMLTVALLGTASFISISLGIPIGVWCARNNTVYSIVRPVLDFMQTMPAFVYLIPVIALFGIGKPPGIIASLMFGIPPVIRLTALGLRGVPHSVREAGTAFGASETYLLFKIDFPLAMPSIMTGVNQAILMCLGMVVIASLIGAKGLGEDVLESLQYASTGYGILTGFAILFCAMVLDRMVHGKGQKRESGHM